MKKNEDAETRYIPIPEVYTRRKLNALYREIPMKDMHSRTMRKYFNAMANLYGVISLKKAYEIVTAQSPSLVTEDAFLAFAEIARHECGDYYILGDEDIYTDGTAGSVWKREIINATLLGDDLDLYLQTKQSQQGKPFFVPKKTELLKYENPFYCEATPEVFEMQAFLDKRFKLSELQRQETFDEILYGSRYLGADFSQMINRLHDMGMVFKNNADVEKFMELHQNFHNTTRMQCNRGHTPKEIFELRPPEQCVPQSISLGPNIRKAIADGAMDAKELCESVMAMEMPNENLRFALLKEIAEVESAVTHTHRKIGRNEPCPCGSGKKYKHCCGR